MKDGHLNKRKECARKDSQFRTERLSKDAVWVERELERQRLKQRQRNKVAVIPLEKKREYLRRHENKYPEKAAARGAVEKAIRGGKLHRKPCQVCGSANSEAHHEDYSMPLDVIWYCPKHHAERHVEIRRANRAARHLSVSSVDGSF